MYFSVYKITFGDFTADISDALQISQTVSFHVASPVSKWFSNGTKTWFLKIFHRDSILYFITNDNETTLYCILSEHIKNPNLIQYNYKLIIKMVCNTKYTKRLKATSNVLLCTLSRQYLKISISKIILIMIKQALMKLILFQLAYYTKFLEALTYNCQMQPYSC